MMAKRNSRYARDKAKANQPKITVAKGRTRTETRNPPPADLDPGLHWYLVYTAPRAEAKAKEKLEDAGCKVFWPSWHVVITAPKRKPVEHDVGTFPRYMFVAGSVLQARTQDRVIDRNTVVTTKLRPLDNILDIRGIAEVVYGGPNQFLRVPTAVIAGIAGFQAGTLNPEKRVEPRLKAGGEAMILDGPFMGFKATIVEAVGMDTAKVLVSMFGSEVNVTLDQRQLEAA